MVDNETFHIVISHVQCKVEVFEDWIEMAEVNSHSYNRELLVNTKIYQLNSLTYTSENNDAVSTKIKPDK